MALGEKESGAAVNLLQHVPTHVKHGLSELVKYLGFKEFKYNICGFICLIDTCIGSTFCCMFFELWVD